MARFTWIMVVGVLCWLGSPTLNAFWQDRQSVSSGAGQKEESRAPNPPTQGPGTAASQGAESLAEILGRGAAKLEPSELAGTGPGIKLAVLGLKQAYVLAQIRARHPEGIPGVVRGSSIDPTAMDEEARRVDAGSFDRFRRDLLSGEFRDPAPSFFAALRHRQAIDSARAQLTLTKELRVLFDELLRGGASGVSQLQLEVIDRHLLLSEQYFDSEMASYRSTVDDLKGSLGLPPGLLMVVDEQILQPFFKIFSDIDSWQHNPRRQLATLNKLHHRLPRLDDVVIGGRSVAQVANGRVFEAEFLLACAEEAAKYRGTPKDEAAARDKRDALELRIRKLARELISTHRNYELQRRSLEVATREVDQRFEQIVSPPPGGPAVLAQAANVSLQTAGVLQTQSRMYRGRAELVAQWLQFREQSLQLYRELGVTRYENWEAFYSSFLPIAGEDQATP